MDSLEQIRNRAEDVRLRYFDELGPWFFIYVALFAIFSVGIIPKDIILIAALLVFAFSPAKEMTYLYIFSLPWMSVATFTFGLTLSLIQSVIYLIKLFITRRALRFTVFELIYCVFLLISGALNFISYRSLTGISFVFYFLIANEMVHDNLKTDKNHNQFWRLALYSLVVSCLFASIYGLMHATTIQRWIKGIGYSRQFYGTMGTTRFGIYLCICTLFALYYVEKKWAKAIIAVILAAGVVATVSMTALILLVLVYVFYYVTQGKLTAGKIATLVAAVLAIGLVLVFWTKIAEISFVKPLATRIELITAQVRAGDLDTATSGRTGLTSAYMSRFNEASFFTKVFGGFSLSLEGVTYSHNSYIDMLNYYGIVGVVLGVILQIKRLKQHAHIPEFKMYLILKFLIIVSAATVSIFSAQYWQIWFYM